VKKYLVEWDNDETFKKCRVSLENFYDKIGGPLEHSVVVTRTHYQLYNLDPDKINYIRISACNDLGCSGAVSSSPRSIQTSNVAPHFPQLIFLRTTRRDISNRLYLEWSEPSVDMFGFDTSSPTCSGSNKGHNIVSDYLITWDISERFLKVNPI
jgi:hypothetical protein